MVCIQYIYIERGVFFITVYSKLNAIHLIHEFIVGVQHENCQAVRVGEQKQHKAALKRLKEIKTINGSNNVWDNKS